LVDECKQGVVTLQTTFCESLISIRRLHKAAGATKSLHKVRNWWVEQKQLESCAKDSDSLVRQGSPTLYLQRVYDDYTFRCV